MKTLSRCTFVVALVLLTVPAVQAAEPAADVPAPDETLVEAPVVETLCPSEQPVVAVATPALEQGLFCIDTDVPCSEGCSSVCRGCTCSYQTGTCVYCP